MRRTTQAAASAVLIGLLAACAAPQPAPAPAAPEAQAALDPDVAAALRQVSDTLAAAPALTVQISTLREGKVNDQTILLAASSALAIRRPDRLVATVGSDLGSFSLFYDGKAVTVFNPAHNTFSTTPLEGTIDTVVRWVEGRLGIEIPVRPFLLADPYADLANSGTTGFRVGATLVRGQPAEHYAMRSPGVDWEVWIGTKAPRLPLRVSVVDRSLPSHDRVTVEFDHWNLSPRLSEGHFTFAPPRGAVPATSVLRPE